MRVMDGSNEDQYKVIDFLCVAGSVLSLVALGYGLVANAREIAIGGVVGVVLTGLYFGFKEDIE